MNPLNPIFAVVVFLIALLTAYIIKTEYKLKTDNARYETIDGMRGFLALGVFIYHSAVWFQYLHINYWGVPESNLYTHLGQTSVSFFFMITAFLFITKILNTNNKKIDWNSLFISRIFRLVPMYLASIAILVLIVFTISQWKMNVSFTSLIKEFFYWTTFTIIKRPTINDSLYTSIINAGVVWSLPYEWLFYFSLPIISIIIFVKRTSLFYTIISIVFILFFYTFRGISPHHFLSFAGGAVAPFLIKYKSENIRFDSKFFSAIVVLCLFLMLFFSTADNLICKILIIIVFNLIALGNSVFGILRGTALKILSEICYSTYLIHGIVIFVIMYFFIGLENAKKLSVIEFWLTIFLITPLVVFASFISFKYIEKPFMNYSKSILSRSRLSFKS